MKAKQRVLADKASLIEAVADKFVVAASNAIFERGVFYVALAGGATPQDLYQKLANSPYVEKIDWQKVHLFFGDERCVLPTDDDSNFKMVRKAMIDHIAIPKQNVHRMPTESGTADDIAVHYAGTMKRVLGTSPLDFVLLGLGADGHIASLFPGTDALDVTATLTTSVYVEKLASWRVTMTYPVINHARQVIILTSGKAKASIVNTVNTNKAGDLPVQRLAPQHDYYWYMDVAAADKKSG